MKTGSAHQANPSIAAPAVLRAPRVSEGAQRFEEDHQVGLLARAEVQGFGGLPVFRVQTHRIDAGVMAHHLSEGIDEAVAAIGTG